MHHCRISLAASFRIPGGCSYLPVQTAQQQDAMPRCGASNARMDRFVKVGFWWKDSCNCCWPHAFPILFMHLARNVLYTYCALRAWSIPCPRHKLCSGVGSFSVQCMQHHGGSGGNWCPALLAKDGYKEVVGIVSPLEMMALSCIEGNIRILALTSHQLDVHFHSLPGHCSASRWAVTTAYQPSWVALPVEP